MSLDGQIEMHLMDADGKEEGGVIVLDRYKYANIFLPAGFLCVIENICSDNLTDDKLALEKVIIVNKNFAPTTASINYKANDGWFHWLTNWWDNENLKINKLVVIDENGKDMAVKFHFVLAK